MSGRELDMKRDWNRRAAENARYYIATTQHASEGIFDESGRRDAHFFFDGLDALLHGTQTVLDIGCGIGRMDRHVAPRVRRLIGIDVSGEMVSRARERLTDVPNAEFVEGDGYSLRPIESESIGLVFSHIVFQHVPRDVAAGYFREAHRVLGGGGSFVFQVPERGIGTPDDPPPDDTFEMRFYEESELRAALEAIGFLWRSARRYPVETLQLRFDQLRVHVLKPGAL